MMDLIRMKSLVDHCCFHISKFVVESFHGWISVDCSITCQKCIWSHVFVRTFFFWGIHWVRASTQRIPQTFFPLCSYLSKMPMPPILVMMGYEQGEHYFLPHCRVEPPSSLQTILFPFIETKFEHIWSYMLKKARKSGQLLCVRYGYMDQGASALWLQYPCPRKRNPVSRMPVFISPEFLISSFCFLSTVDYCFKLLVLSEFCKHNAITFGSLVIRRRYEFGIEFSRDPETFNRSY